MKLIEKIDFFGTRRLGVIREILSTITYGNKEHISERKHVIKLFTKLDSFNDKWFTPAISKYLKELSKDFLSGKGI